MKWKLPRKWKRVMACDISPLMMFVISSQFCQCVPFEWLWVNAWNVQNDLRGKITHKQTNVANYLLGIVSFENILNILYIHRHDPIEMTCMMADDWSACFWQNVETSSLTHGAPSNGVRRPEVEKSRTLSRSTAWEKGALWVWENGQLNKIKKSLAFGFTLLHLYRILFTVSWWSCEIVIVIPKGLKQFVFQTVKVILKALSGSIMEN